MLRVETERTSTRSTRAEEEDGCAKGAVRQCRKVAENVSEVQHGLAPEVEEQVEDGEVGLEAPLLAVDLVVRTRREVGIGQRMLETYDIAEVGAGHGVASLIMLGELQRRLDVDEFADGMCNGQVEVEEKFPPSLEEGPQVVGQHGHEADGLENFCTITGGKLTTFRLMAQATADLVAARLGVDAP